MAFDGLPADPHHPRAEAPLQRAPRRAQRTSKELERRSISCSFFNWTDFFFFQVSVLDKSRGSHQFRLVLCHPFTRETCLWLILGTGRLCLWGPFLEGASRSEAPPSQLWRVRVLSLPSALWFVFCFFLMCPPGFLCDDVNPHTLGCQRKGTPYEPPI